MTAEREKTTREREVKRKLHEALSSVGKYFSETPVRFDAQYETVYDKSRGMYIMNLTGESAKDIAARHRKERRNPVLAWIGKKRD